MSIKAEWQVTGLVEAQEKCQLIMNNINTKIPQIFQTLGHQMVSAMQAKAPVRTGFLRDNITLEQQNAFTLTIVSGAPYSAFVEFGTHKMAPREFFFSVVYEFAPQIVQQITNNVLI